VLVCDGVESITHLSRGRGRSTQETSNSVLEPVAGSSRQQHDQGEYGG